MKNTQSVHFDNIATASHPVYRRRMRAPFTVFAVRMQLAAQAAELPEWEQEAYLSARLTDLDKALDGDQAQALEHWLDCEELLLGRIRCSDYGDRVLGSGRPDPVADEDMEALAAHARVKAKLGRYRLAILGRLAKMMGEPRWEFTGYFVNDVRNAAAGLTKLHTSLHS